MTRPARSPAVRSAPAVQRLVGVLGRGLVQADEPVLAADDLGLTRGDGCFEATRVTTSDDGRHAIDHLDGHLDRLAASCRALQLPPPDRVAWTELISECLAAWTRPGEAMLRLMLTRGRESRSDPSAVTGVLTVAPIAAKVLDQRRRGITVATLCRGVATQVYTDAPWLLGGVKTLSYALNVAAYREAERRGAEDVVFTSTDGYLLEAPTSALVWAVDGALFSTPVDGTGILASITQHALFTAAREAGMEAVSALGRPADLLTADGAWLVSSGRGVAAIRSCDGTALRTDAATTNRLAELAGFGRPAEFG